MRRGRTHDGRALESGGGAEHEGYENALHLYLGWYLELLSSCAWRPELLQPSSHPSVPHFSRLRTIQHA